MQIIPAIDLINGTCVRLAQGKFDAVTKYDEDVQNRLSSFINDGAELIHIVDLDGAKSGAPQQYDLIGGLERPQNINLQAAGGVRSKEHVSSLREAGIEKVVIGSLTVKQPDLVFDIITEFQTNHITLALDVIVQDEEPFIATHGWQETSSRTLWDLLECFGEFEGLNILVTDVSRDGMLSGPNIPLLSSIRKKFPDVKLQASGGVGSLDDILALKAADIEAVIVGRALYENKFTLREAIDAGT